MDGSSKARSAVRLATTSSGDAEMDSKLWLKVLEERDRGWLIGPLSWAELEEYAVVSKRFPIQQGAKLRPIDDFSMSTVNTTVSMRDQATDGVDIIAATMCVFMRALTKQGRSTQLLARSFDLSAAYRQLCVWPHRPIPLLMSVCTVLTWVSRVYFNRYACPLVLERLSTPLSGVQGAFNGLLQSASACLRRATTMTSLRLARQSLVRVVRHACPCS